MENRRLIFFLFFLYFFIGYQGTILRYIRAYTRIGFMQRKFNRRTVYACLRDVVVPAAGILKREAFFIGPLYERQRFYHSRSLQTLRPPHLLTLIRYLESACENERNKTSVVSLVSRWDTITVYICSACEGYEEEKDDRWNIPKIYLHKNMNIILPIIFQLLLAFSSLFHSVSIYSKKQSASR